MSVVRSPHIWLAVLAAGWGFPAGWAAMTPPPQPQQDEGYVERDVLDPATDSWAPASRPAEGVSQVELDQGRRLLAQGEARAARKLLAKWVEANPDHERYIEGVFLYAESLFEVRDYYKAYENYQIVVEGASGDLFYRALRREMDVARAFLAGEPRIVWRVFRLPAYDDGLEILDRVWERVPGSRVGEEALKIKADYLFATGQMSLAQDEYALLAREYPSGRYTPIALLRSAEAANAAFPGVQFDDRPLIEARARYEQLREAYPVVAEREDVETRLAAIRDRQAEKDLEIARWYERTRQQASAEFYYRRILRDWPETLAASAARVRLRGLGVEVEAEPAPPEPPASAPSSGPAQTQEAMNP